MMTEKPKVSTSLKIGVSVPSPHTPKAGRPEMIPVGFFHRSGVPATSSADAAWAGITIPKRWVQGMAVEIPWADMQPNAQGETFDPVNPIAAAVSQATDVQLQLKLRHMYGGNAPGWAKSMGGAPINMYEPGTGATFTMGRVWSQAYVAAAAEYIEQFAEAFNPLAFPVTQLLDISCSICMTRFAEPFIRQSSGNETNTFVTANKAAMQAAGWTLNQDVLAETAMMEAHRPVDMLVSLACNPFQKVNDGTDAQISRQLMKYFRGTMAQWGCLGNNSDRVAPGWPNSKYETVYDEITTQGPPVYIQTAAPGRVGNLFETCQKAVTYGATYIELPGTTEQYTDTDVPTGMSPDQFDEILDGLIANAASIGYDFELPPDPPPPTGPQVTSFTPSSATVGSTVTILGTAFLGATAVLFNGVASVFNVINSTSITAVVPSGATSGAITVTTPNGSDASSTDFVVDLGLPIINSFNPTSGQVNASVTILGDNFTGTTSVRFNSTLAAFTLVDDNTIVATVPVGATTGSITVTTPQGTVQSATNFTVTVPPPAAPIVTSFAPLSGSAAGGGGTGIPLGGPFPVGITTFTVNVAGVGNRTCTARYPAITAGTNTPAAAGVFPLIMVGHGSALNGASAATTHNFLAMDGYIVVGPSFGNIVGNITEGADVTTAVIDFLDALTTGILANKVDVGRIGYAGTSMGGMIGYRLMHPTGGDPRIKAFFVRAADATGSPAGDFETGPALLHCHGTADSTVSNASGHTAYDRAQEPKGFIDLAGAGHDLVVSGTYFQDGARGLFKRYMADLAGGPAQIQQGVNNTPTATYTNDGIAEATQSGGTSVVITGTGFTSATAVRFNGVLASFVVDSGLQITATVPTGATSGPIQVTTPNGTGQSSTNFVVTGASAPTVTSFTPTSGAVGTSVAIVGTGFTGVSAVRFNGVNAAFVVNSATSITATVPAGATTGPVSVVATAGTGTSGANFTVPGPTITSFAPTSGAGGTVVGIVGTGFLGATAVTFNGVAAAAFVVNSATSITATVPGTATSGPIRVVTPAGTAVSATNFSITGTPWRNPAGVWSIRQTTSSSMGSSETTGANNSLNKSGVVGYGRRFGANLVLPATQGGPVNLAVLQVGLDKAKSMGKLFKPRVMLGQYLPSWAIGPTFTDQYGTGPIGFTSTGGAVTQLEDAIRQLAEAFAAFAVANPEVMMIDCAWPSLDYSELNYSPGVQNAYGRSEPTNRASSIAAHQRIMKIWFDAITPFKIPVGFGLSGRGPITNHATALTQYAHTLAGNDSPGIVLQANGFGYASGVYGEWGGGLESALDAILWTDTHVTHALQDIHPANGGARSTAQVDEMHNAAESSPVRAKYIEYYSDQFGLTYFTNQAAYDRFLQRIAAFGPGPF